MTKTPTVASWKRLIADIQKRARTTTDPDARKMLQIELTAAHDGLRATQRAVAHAPSFVTHTNLFALKEMVIQYGPDNIPMRVPAVDAPHLKRCVQAGLLEASGGRMRLTAEGRTRVADELVQDIANRSGIRERPDELPRYVEKRATELRQREDALAKLR